MENNIIEKYNRIVEAGRKNLKDNRDLAIQRAAEIRRGKTLSEEHKAKMKESQHARRERERLEKEEKIASGELVPFSRPKRTPKPKPDPNAPKRPVGRPKKEVVKLVNTEETPRNGTQEEKEAIPFAIPPVSRSVPAFVPLENEHREEAEPLPIVERRTAELIE